MSGEEAGKRTHFHILHIEHSEVSSVVDTLDGYECVLVVEDDLSEFVLLAPAKACTATFATEQLVK